MAMSKISQECTDISVNYDWSFKFRMLMRAMRNPLFSGLENHLQFLVDWALSKHVCRAETEVKPGVPADWIWPVAHLPRDLTEKLRTDSERSFSTWAKSESLPKQAPHENEEFRSFLRLSRVVLYFHGGAYCLLSKGAIRGVAYAYAEKGNCIVFTPDYRLIPTVTIDGVVDDALASYRFLLDAGAPPENIIFSGESAGGALCVLLCNRLRECGMPLPMALMLSSPWVDLACTRFSNAHPMSRYDYIDADSELFRNIIKLVAGDKELHDPLLSPISADLRGLPPTYIQLGEWEILRPQIEAFREKLKEADVTCEMDIVPKMPHVPVFWMDLHPEAAAAADIICHFVRDPQNIMPLHQAPSRKKWEEVLNKEAQGC